MKTSERATWNEGKRVAASEGETNDVLSKWDYTTIFVKTNPALAVSYL